MSDRKVAATNSKALHDYFIEERFEAGIALKGTEVKSLREGRANLRDSFARVDRGEVFLHHCHISPYSHGNIANHDPLRVRKLLLNRKEIDRLYGKTLQRGYTLVPLSIYFKRGIAKVELGLGRGKQAADKRETLKRKIAQREMERAISKRER
jgi:SsrA-binding protein